MSMELVASILAVGISAAHAADLPVKAPTNAASALPAWACDASTRISKGLLYDGPGFFGTREWALNTFVGCAEANGGWDWDIIANTPLKGMLGSEFDAEGGYTVVSGNFKVRFGGGYWNVQATPTERFQIAEFQAKPSYTVKFRESASFTGWLRLEHQRIFAPSFARDEDTNLGIGANLAVGWGDIATVLLEAAHYWHVQSFGPGRHVNAFTAEVPFNIGTYAGLKTTMGPWGRATCGNILVASCNGHWQTSFGGKVAASW